MAKYQIALEIDPETGVILNWNAEAVREAISAGLSDSFGDYVELEIDPETGVILNWNAEAVREAISARLSE